MANKYWLMKSEPRTFSFVDLKTSPKKTTMWEGVRNYQARNFLRDEISVGDDVLFYHSVVDPVGIMGTAKVVRSSYPDPTQFDPESKYYDSKATPQAPRWYVVDIRFEREFKKMVSLEKLRELPGLEDMMVLRKGSRLSVQPVTWDEWNVVTQVGG